MFPKPLKGKIRDRDGVYSCGTITLGGVETKDGTRGFIVSGHVITGTTYTMDDLTNTDIVIGHGEYVKTYDIGRLLGKVHKRSKIEDSGGEKVVIADAAFVAYPQPKTSGCSLTWRESGESFCLDLGSNQIERVAPLRIRGKEKEVYTVIGSQQPKKDVGVWITGAVSGVVDKNLTMSGRKVLTNAARHGLYQYAHTIPAGPVDSSSDTTRGGDSGAPIFTIPDKSGNVRIVGVLQGEGLFGDGTILNIIFSSWDEVTDALDLKPID